MRTVNRMKVEVQGLEVCAFAQSVLWLGNLSKIIDEELAPPQESLADGKVVPSLVKEPLGG